MRRLFRDKSRWLSGRLLFVCSPPPAAQCKVRGAVGDALKRHNASTGAHPDPVQLFVGKTKEVHDRHCAALESEEFTALRRTALPFGLGARAMPKRASTGEN